MKLSMISNWADFEEERPPSFDFDMNDILILIGSFESKIRL